MQESSVVHDTAAYASTVTSFVGRFDAVLPPPAELPARQACHTKQHER